jgi:hypothetical protein
LRFCPSASVTGFGNGLVELLAPRLLFEAEVFMPQGSSNVLFRETS